MLEPCVVLVWNTAHFDEHVLHHEDDLSVLGLLVIADGVRFLQQRDQVHTLLVIAHLSRCFSKFVLFHCHKRVGRF